MQKPERILGAIIAGGASRRFGSDKALALIHGRPMLSHVCDALRRHVTALVICGRAWPGELSIPDLRHDRLGPLAGLEAALDHAMRHNFHAVLTTPVDTLPLPENLLESLRGDSPAVYERQHVIGYWPARCRDALSAYLAAGRRDVAGWIGQSRARLVVEPDCLQNVNVPADLANPELQSILCRARD